MKTVIISCTISHSTVTGYYLAIAQVLVEMGYRVVFLADKIEAHPFKVNKKIKVLRWPSNRPTRLTDFIFACRIFLRYRPTAVLAMFSSVNICLLAGFLVRVPHRLVWSHTLSTAFNDSKKLVKRKSRLLRLATEVIVNSEATRQDMLVNFKVPPRKLTIFPNALETPQVSCQTDPNKITFVGRLVPEKGIDLLLEAMPLVIEQHPQVRLEVIGGKLGMGKIKQYSAKCEELGILSQVDFVGMKSRPKVFQRLASAALCVMPSFAEGFGLVIIESFAVGTPVVATNATAMKEIVRDGVDGLLFPAGNKMALASCINTVLASSTVREELAGNCKARFLSTYRLDEVAVAVATHLAK